MNTLQKQALEEYGSDINTAHHGGVNGRPFWNIHSTQFMFNPCFQFNLLEQGCQPNGGPYEYLRSCG